MSHLLEERPFAARDDAAFLREMDELTRWHRAHCPEYAQIWPETKPPRSSADLPFLHVSLFKHLLLQTRAEGIVHQRTLLSSSTTGSQPSRIALDERSSALQSRSSLAILTEMVGPERRPLLVLDDARNLRQRGEVSARIAAAMALRPLAIETHFLLDEAGGRARTRWELLADILRRHDDLLVYGITFLLWNAWAKAGMPDDVRNALAGKRIHFVHSGGWKKLESLKIQQAELETEVLAGLDPRSAVVDFYGLVEQIGVVFPLCQAGARHVPRWADVLVRDPWTLAPLTDDAGLLQIMNVLAFGAPYQSILTEDQGRLLPEGPCACGRQGKRFELLGRLPQSETRGCANV
jgi:Acyl-protein synthetase, LuxE